MKCSGGAGYNAMGTGGESDSFSGLLLDSGDCNYAREQLTPSSLLCTGLNIMRPDFSIAI